MSFSLDSPISDIFSEISYFIENIFYEVGPGVIFVVLGAVALFFAGISFATYLLKSYAVFSLAKKFGSSNAVFAWIPVFHDQFCMYVLSELTGKNDFSVHPKTDELLKLKSRKTAFYIYVVVSVGLPLVLGGISFIINMILGIIPVIGQIIGVLISSALNLIPAVLIIVFRIVYLRDILDALRTDMAANRRSAMIVCIASHFIHLVFPIYLLTLLKETPLNTEERYAENPEACGFTGSPAGNPAYPPYNAYQGNFYGAPVKASRNEASPADSQQTSNGFYGDTQSE